MPSPDCPCHSKLRYRACCEPLHTGSTSAETPRALMRSRYAAFALGLGRYLVETLAHDHSDREGAEPEALARELSRAKESQRFLSLQILEAQGAQVLFYARIDARGRDISFVELSDFRLEQGGWRYASGVLLPRASLPERLDGLTIASFLALTGR